MTDWKSNLQHTLSETDSAITKLSESKRLAEYALMAKEMPLHVVLECLVTRENRVAIDLVRDEVEAELNKVRERERYNKEFMLTVIIDRKCQLLKVFRPFFIRGLVMHLNSFGKLTSENCSINIHVYCIVVGCKSVMRSSSLISQIKPKLLA